MRYWQNPNGSVEAYSHDLDITEMEGHSLAVEITKAEFGAVLASLPQPSPAPPRKIKLKDKTGVITEYEVVE